MTSLRFLATGVVLLGVIAAVVLYAAKPAMRAPHVVVQPPLQYRCPMHPGRASEQPGNCSACGMAMVPRVASLDSAAGATSDHLVRVSPEQQRLIGLVLETVEPRSAGQSIHAVGRVAVDEARAYPVVAGADGWVREVFAGATTGSSVRKGQPLATVNGRDYTTPQRTFLFALRAAESAAKSDISVDGFREDPEVALEEARLDLLKLGMSDPQIDKLRSTHQVELSVTLSSPVTGILIERGAYPQQAFSHGAELFRVADLSHVWILADLSSAAARSVVVGSPVRVSVPDRPDLKLRAHVAHALPLFDGATRTLRVRLQAGNPGLVLRPDMVVDVALPVRALEGITVPAGAVIESERGACVFVQRSESVFEAREVVTGSKQGDRVQIVSGLATGEVVVVTGQFLLDSERRMRGDVTSAHD